MICGLLWSIQIYTLQLRASYVGFILTLHRRSPCVVYFSAGWYSCIPPTATVYAHTNLSNSDELWAGEFLGELVFIGYEVFESHLHHQNRL